MKEGVVTVTRENCQEE
ncbi:hypothetical protein A2U01_0106341, partial [Trifolium medium]|nr:hypothetical protein [Trifolium medium]